MLIAHFVSFLDCCDCSGPDHAEGPLSRGASDSFDLCESCYAGELPSSCSRTHRFYKRFTAEGGTSYEEFSPNIESFGTKTGSEKTKKAG